VPDDCHDEQDRICGDMVSPKIIAPAGSGSWPLYIAFQGLRLRELTSGGGWPLSRHFVVADEVVSRMLEQSSTDENHSGLLMLVSLTSSWFLGFADEGDASLVPPKKVSTEPTDRIAEVLKILPRFGRRDPPEEHRCLSSTLLPRLHCYWEDKDSGDEPSAPIRTPLTPNR